ncbi:MAG: hypothetical protein ABW168_04395 [Sedimenticola sp.]
MGHCGNSGYSPQPHIHLHLQVAAQPGDSSLPYVFGSHIQQGRFIAYGIPEEGAQIEPFLPETGLQQALSLTLDRKLQYHWYRDGELQWELRIEVRMNPSGETYLDSGRGHLYFNQSDSEFYCYRLEGRDPALALLFSALPRIPLGGDAGMSWQDTLPLQVLRQGWRWHLASLLRAVLPTVGDSHYSARWQQTNLIEGRVRHAGGEMRVMAHLGSLAWFNEITIGRHRLVGYGAEGVES